MPGMSQDDDGIVLYDRNRRTVIQLFTFSNVTNGLQKAGFRRAVAEALAYSIINKEELSTATALHCAVRINLIKLTE